MAYLQNITRLARQDNTGSIQQLSVVRRADVLTIPTPTGRTIYGAIQLKAGASFVTFQVTQNTARTQSTDNPTREGNSKRNTLPFTIPKDRPELRAMFDLMVRDEFIVIFTENGRQKIFGQLHAPVQFSYSHDSGANISDLNAYECRFYYEGPDNIYFYNGSVSAPTGPAPAIVRFNGVAIASLQAGETLNIESEYSFTQYFTT